ncbi:MAG: type II toxin-antitoxin system RelE/ParE family toxin [Candidatus Schekmanbacteria bacterium]|nr:type II toxin-antitoxin system RelE/ParE family toxin [Candidatus Schekmanbacteria bacterium]
MLTVEIHPEAYKELEQSKSWYDERSKNLGSEFLFAVERAVRLIQEFPARWPLYSGVTKRFLLHRFPFGLVYRYDENRIQILAIVHTRRKPGYWEKRKL